MGSIEIIINFFYHLSFILMNKITLLHEAITTRLDTVAQEHMLDVSDAYKKAYIQDGKMQ